jgi:hypothetical protein
VTETLEARQRRWPDDDAPVYDVVVGFLGFIHATSVNKLVGLTEAEARATPLATSPAMSLLGLVKHLTAVQREHIQRRIGRGNFPSLWRSDDTTFEFRVDAEETIASVVEAYDDEWERTKNTLARVDPASYLMEEGPPKRVGRVVVDVMQESARHLGHIDILREMLDGATGE